ncbi:hypothetical protein CASFOL_007117 [Castilleja foliolosa]|uniref:Smr domain-containing protein n=1 Tax=Castilleja foliolosa TaxID=1961234 RepID=A0ABD3E983_9LAMI
MNLSGKKATLNPNATAFVPLALRSQTSFINTSDASSKISPPSQHEKSILDRSESSISKHSDEEAHQYWRNQLPDDITPDFEITGFDNAQEINDLSFPGLSLTDIDQRPRFTSSASSGFIPKQQGLSPLAKPWEKQIVENDSYNGISRIGVLDGMSNEQLLIDDEDVSSPFEFLASQFPGFAAESLAEVYSASGGDLNLTVEMLTQLELQVELDGGLNQTLNSKALSTPNLSPSDFPALSVTNSQNGWAKFDGDDHRNVSPFWSPDKDSSFLFRSFSAITSRGATDFASAVKKTAPQEPPSIWKYDNKGSSDTSIGSSRSSQVLRSSYNSGQDRGIFGNTLRNQGPARASPVWLETGESVANMYSEMRGEARDHARIRNAYFEQARQAYLIGNKALAKELSIKGQMHNMQMKEAHEKAQDSIYRQRNASVMQANGRERMIDLHGLHVSEAIHVLKRELAVLRNAARSADQRMLVYICVGTGHHTRGSRTPSRLPTAVQRYLLEEEGLDFSEPQPGLLRVVIF